MSKRRGMNDKTLVTVNCSMCCLPMYCEESLLQDYWQKVPEKDKEGK